MMLHPTFFAKVGPYTIYKVFQIPFLCSAASTFLIWDLFQEYGIRKIISLKATSADPPLFSSRKIQYSHDPGIVQRRRVGFWCGLAHIMYVICNA
jgi:hypothetical protein